MPIPSFLVPRLRLGTHFLDAPRRAGECHARVHMLSERPSLSASRSQAEPGNETPPTSDLGWTDFLLTLLLLMRRKRGKGLAMEFVSVNFEMLVSTCACRQLRCFATSAMWEGRPKGVFFFLRSLLPLLLFSSFKQELQRKMIAEVEASRIVGIALAQAETGEGARRRRA